MVIMTMLILVEFVPQLLTLAPFNLKEENSKFNLNYHKKITKEALIMKFKVKTGINQPNYLTK